MPAILTVLLALSMLLPPAPAAAQTPQQWVEWGDRVHGGFGSLIAYGIRVGLDAMERLGAERRQIVVEYANGPDAPCPCVVDGIALAVSASVGQRTLAVGPEEEASELLGRVRFVHRPSGRAIVYRLPISALPLMDEINRDLRGVERFEAVMRLDPAVLYTIE